MSNHIIHAMAALLFINILLLTSCYVFVNGVYKIPFLKISQVYDNIKFPVAILKKKILEIPIPNKEELEDWDSGEIPWELDKNVTQSRKNPEKNYESTDEYRLGMLFI